METFGTALQPFLAWLLETTLVASVVICLILVLQKLLGRRLGPRWSHALWLVLLLRMVLPWTPPSPISLFLLVPTSFPRDAARELTNSAPRAIDSAGLTETTPAAAPAPPESSAELARPQLQETARTAPLRPPFLATIRRMLPLLWLAGMVLFGGYLVASNFALWRIIKREHPLTAQPILELFEQCKTQMGVGTIVALIPSDHVRTAALFGFVRPRLLLPREMVESTSRDELRYIFLHELAHLKRHDIYIGWLTSLLQVLHWFNPLVWLAFYRMRSDRELACDALVLTRTKAEESHDYGRTMVGLLDRFSRARPLPAMAGILESKAQLKRRITMIARFQSDRYRWSPTAIILILALACASLINAQQGSSSPLANDREQTSADQSSPSPQPVFRKIKIASNPQNGVLSPDGNKLACISEGAVWVIPLHGKVDPDIAGEPIRIAEVPGIWDNGSLMAWSADGEWIAVNTWPDAEEVFVYVIPPAGGEPRVFQMPKRGSHAWSYRLSLSPDGQMLAFSALELRKPRQKTSDGHDRYICTIPTAGGEPKQVSSGWGRMPSFSPDGETIAYVDSVRKNWQGTERYLLGGELWIVPSEGGTPVKLASVEGRLRGPVWSPDGKYIAVHHEPGSTNDSKEVWVFPLSPDASSVGEPEKIALPHSSWNMLAGWTPEGQLGVFLTPQSHRACYTVPASGGKAVQITPAGARPYYPRWSPDGERIYFRVVDGTNVLLSYVPAAGGNVGKVPLQTERFVTTVPGGGHNISPDGTKIVVSSSHDIWTITLKDGLRTRLTNDKSHEAYPCWSPDGEWVAFVDEANYAIYIIPAGGGEIRQVSSESDRVGHGAITFSPDGELIAFFSDGSIKTIPVKGGEPTILVGKVKWGYHSQLAYSPDGSKIAHNAEGKIWITSLDGGEPQELSTGLPKNARLGGFGWSPDGEKITFIATIGGEKELWLIENFLPTAALAKPEPMTTVRRIGSDWGTFASLSPDGRYMCDVDRDTETLAVLELATGEVRHLTGKSPDDASYPLESAISPDSKEVAYLWWDPNTKASSLHVVGLDGSGHRLLSKGRYPMPRAWSADGQKILAVISENDVQQMVWVSASDGSMERIASFPGESLGYPGKFDISPDGRFIAYDRPQAENTSQRDIFLFDLIDNREFPIVEHPSDDKLLGWTPDGQYIFFASGRTGNWDAWLLQIADGKPQGFPELTKQGMGDVKPIGFMPYGSYYYAHERVLQDVFIARLDLETGAVLSEPMPVRQTGATACHDWSPDGRYLAYCERRPDESQVIHIRTLATGRERTLADNLSYIRWLRWSLDGRSVLIDGARRGDSQGVIRKIDVQTGEQSDLVRSQTEVLIRPEMSPDGKTLFFDRSDPKSETSRLMARDLESGREKELFRVESPARLAGSALSPDGRQFVLSVMPSRTGPEGPVLKTLSTAGGQPRELIQFKVSENLRTVGVTWMPDSQNVLFWKWFQHFKDLELWRISAEGGEPRKLWSWKPRGQMRIHPDGQHVAFYDRSTTRGIWVMENFLPLEAGK